MTHVCKRQPTGVTIASRQRISASHSQMTTTSATLFRLSPSRLSPLSCLERALPPASARALPSAAMPRWAVQARAAVASATRIQRELSCHNQARRRRRRMPCSMAAHHCPLGCMHATPSQPGWHPPVQYVPQLSSRRTHAQRTVSPLRATPTACLAWRTAQRTPPSLTCFPRDGELGVPRAAGPP